MFGHGINSTQMCKELKQSLNGIHINFKAQFLQWQKGEKNVACSENFIGKFKCTRVIDRTSGEFRLLGW